MLWFYSKFTSYAYPFNTCTCRLSSTLNSGSTPTKDGMDEVLSIITPEMKKNLFTAADDDEDSGIGMELKKVRF